MIGAHRRALKVTWIALSILCAIQSYTQSQAAISEPVGESTVASDENKEIHPQVADGDRAKAPAERRRSLGDVASDQIPPQEASLDLSKTELILGLAAFLVALTTGLAALLIALTTFIFGVAIAAVGWLSFAKYKDAERRLEQSFQRFDQESNKLRSLDEELEQKTYEMREEISKQEQLTFSHRRYFEQVRLQIFDLLVGIVENVEDALVNDQETHLKALIGEAEACLSLFSPRDGEVQKALWRLGEIGSEHCISSLKTVVDDPQIDPVNRLEAQRVLDRVKYKLDDELVDYPPAAEIHEPIPPGEG